MDRRGTKFLIFATTLLISIFSGVFIFDAYSAAAGGGASGGGAGSGAKTGGGSCTKDCKKATEACKPAKTSSGTNFVRMSSSKISGKCLMDLSGEADACFNHVPVSYVNNYSLTGSRWRWSPTGAKHYGKRSGTIYTGSNLEADKAAGYVVLGNHFGADLGAGGRTDVVAYAAADGNVVYAGCAGGSGLTIAIEHKKKCDGGGAYTTIYRHMNDLYVGYGPVKKGDKIGRVSGKGKCPIEKPLIGKRKANDSYDPHLHFEVYDGALAKNKDGEAKNTGLGGNTSADALKNILDSSCGDMQVLCGACPKNTGACPSTTQAAGDGTAATGDPSGSAPGDTTSSSGSSDDGGCKLKPYFNADECVFCPMFKVLFNTASSAAKVANDTLAEPSRNLVLIGFLIWLAIAILKSFGNLAGVEPGDLLKEIFKQGFRVAVVIVILQKAAIYETMDLTLNPVMQTGLNFSQSLNGDDCPSGGASYLNGIQGYEAGKYNESASGGLSIDLGKSILCSIKNLEDNVGVMLGLGNYSCCLGTHDELIWYIIPHPAYLLTGVALWVAGALLLLAFPWCLVDCILQICIAASLVPCAIACFAFKSTQKYIIIVWNFFLNAMFNIVFLSIIMYLINEMFSSWTGLPTDLNGVSVANKVFVTAHASTMLGGIAAWGAGFLKIAGVCFLCWTFFDEAKDMATKFADSPSLGGSKGIGRMVGGTALSAVNNTAKGTYKLGKKAGGAVGHRVADKVTNTKLYKLAASKISHARTGVRNWGLAQKSKVFNAMANTSLIGGNGSYDIVDADGNVVGKKMKFRAFGIEQERTFEKDENGNWTQQKDTHVRSGVEKAFEAKRDNHGNIKKITATDEDGNLYEVNDIQARHRLLGVQRGELEDMEAHVETLEDGSKVVVYENKDENGEVKSKLVTDLDGNALRYKTAFTRSLKIKGLYPFYYGQEEWKAYSHRTKMSGGDAVMRTRSITGGNGQVQRADAELRGYYADRLVAQNGSIDRDAFNDILSKATDKDTAKLAIINTVLQKRGENTLNTEYKSRQIQTANDGSLIVTMNIRSKTDPNKEVQRQLSAKIVDDRLIIIDTNIDENGNISSKKDNGIHSVTKNFTWDEQKQNYKGTEHYDFSAYAKSKSTFGGMSMNKFDLFGHRVGVEFGTPLSEKGKLNSSLDRQDIMKGFTKQDYNEHLMQRQGNDRYNTLNASYIKKDGQSALDRKLTGDEVRKILNPNSSAVFDMFLKKKMKI